MKIEYKVGDLVVETSRHTDDQIYKIKEDHGEHCFYVGTNGGDRDFWTLFLGEIRHATPQEIQAGKRLEVCSE